jgi:hypothetical protein
MTHLSLISDVSSSRKEEAQRLLAGFEQAKAKRRLWEEYWQDCYDLTFPSRNISSFAKGFSSSYLKKSDRIFDATASDAADQLAASLLGYLTPPYTPWFGLRAGADLSEEDQTLLTPVLEKATRILQSQFDRSNFTVEIHQCFLDLVIAGTASLAFEENPNPSYAAFHFTALPLADMVLDEHKKGLMDVSYRTLSLTKSQWQDRYPFLVADEFWSLMQEVDDDEAFLFLEVIEPHQNNYQSQVQLSLLCLDDRYDGDPLWYQTLMAQAPILNFRWMKSAGDLYGRSPIMKVLPDIKTANKVVELILKNASISVTGVWQAEDDGVLNPATIELVPGAIIPKAMGSKGLTPLEMPSKFDVSQLILDDLRSRIRHALLVDRLPQINGLRMTATEILERSSEMALLLGATYGRLQSELLVPLIQTGYAILRKRGEVPDLPLDGRYIEIDFRSPLAKAQSQRHVQSLLSWVEAVKSLGAEALSVIDLPQTIREMAHLAGVPKDLIVTKDEQKQEIQHKGDVNV